MFNYRCAHSTLCFLYLTPRNQFLIGIILCNMSVVERWQFKVMINLDFICLQLISSLFGQQICYTRNIHTALPQLQILLGLIIGFRSLTSIYETFLHFKIYFAKQRWLLGILGKAPVGGPFTFSFWSLGDILNNIHKPFLKAKLYFESNQMIALKIVSFNKNMQILITFLKTMPRFWEK